ncbi:hypothetical protein [Kosakonia sp. S42]|uniref:hypothetical protein n=1 Tax=Kosakonia sp. S42 TaxID=2767458 RepID=UPI00190CC66C|nr:hypothetical protein [Kosakonia sp. S42]MBK0018745.1 hypothetical protein [Kosakonia sp. S42]
MRISEVDSALVTEPGSGKRKKENAFPPFQSMLNASLQNSGPQAMSAQPPTRSEAPDAVQSAAPVDKIGVARKIDMEHLLTERDKAILGWPGHLDNITVITAATIALDRESGQLTGPITKEYLFGDPGKGTCGILGGFPPETISQNKDVIPWMLQRFERLA